MSGTGPGGPHTLQFEGGVVRVERETFARKHIRHVGVLRHHPGMLAIQHDPLRVPHKVVLSPLVTCLNADVIAMRVSKDCTDCWTSSPPCSGDSLV